MKIAILEKTTNKLVYSTEVHLTGQNYQPTEAELFNLAWRAAVEDCAVKEDAREGYVVTRVQPPKEGA